MNRGKPFGDAGGRLALSLLCLSLAACGGGGGGPVPPSTPTPLPSAVPSPSPSASPVPSLTPTPVPTALEARLVRPSQTAAGLDNQYGDHRVYWPSTLLVPRGAVLFLPGSGLAPAQYDRLMRFAAAQGQVVLGLAYVNDPPVNALCPPDFQTLSGPCHGDLRAEIVYGEPRSDLVEVSPAESVQGRLHALLSYLVRNEPGVEWARLLDEARPRWSVMTLAGHSQGGGHAAFVAQREPVHRAVLLSATEPARWTEATEATPRAAFFGFAHVREVGFGGITTSWDRLQIPGELIEIDPLLPEVPGSQRLFTSAAACDNNENSRHGCTSMDLFLPRQADGQLLFAPVFAAWLAPRQP